MRFGHLVVGLLFLVAFVGCKKADRAKQTPADAKQTRAEPATAQPTASASAAPSSPPNATGNVHSKGGELGTWDIVLRHCESGEVDGFFGVDLYLAGSDDWRVRYVHDEAMGEIVKVLIPTKKTALVFDRDAKCSVLEGSIEKMHVTTWTSKGKIRHLEGHVKFDCTHSGGKGHVTGEATFSGCH